MSRDDRQNKKLIGTKEQWAREGRGLTGQTADPKRARLPPGQRLVKDFPVLDLGPQPNMISREWMLSTAGQIDQPIKWSFDDLMAQPQVEIVSDIHCVTTWSRYDNRWKGVSAKHLLAEVQPRENTAFLMVRSYDGYATNVPLSWIDDDDVLLAHTWNGAPLTREHGGPVRLVIPKLYFWKSAKWIRHITFMGGDAPGYWEARGYHAVGDPWKEQRYG
ncbi:MAG: sulfite oxidase-like oxidoreductase [Rhodospirillaceae bacterium]|jgi:DMSO/TMAO reductase YedYZ molybdopterin-dependent catalytic subunit|nr:sulfite oxidase-like oxidoreductase [Rhodospirillaceae bacterium]MBT5239797.1 sulfite oxidase-like oxidoreductase [Rhodospirillaceae bacterium]MBT5567187.1 sulfite oxidase-like oxidoreductase [Rhodospirillaceae bacterium]MBT6089400.1 sulfite oxidase-like oxidoreductase [Rhodospirillaceae bacterium]MBT6962126.1 sulfite oxidase-like oxidoreductase [Rhodospirillaceae bacterium]